MPAETRINQPRHITHQMAVPRIQGKNKDTGEHDAAYWERRRRFLRFLLRYPGWLLMRVSKPEGLENIPREGPAIVIINHIGWVDPLVALHVSPRSIVPMGKIEAFNWPVIGILPRLWGAIPVNRDEVDSKALRSALDALRGGDVVLVAPEGTRNDALEQGLEGFAYLATRSGVPIIPAAVADTEGFPAVPFSKRWRGPAAKIRFGKAFRYRAGFQRAKRGDLRRLTDAAMYALAEMLPEPRRGFYSDLTKFDRDLLEWI